MSLQAMFIWMHQTLSNQTQKHGHLVAGQGLVEYALLMILVGVVVMALLVVFGPTLSNIFQNIYDSVSGAGA